MKGCARDYPEPAFDSSGREWNPLLLYTMNSDLIVIAK